MSNLTFVDYLQRGVSFALFSTTIYATYVTALNIRKRRQARRLAHDEIDDSKQEV